MKENYTEKDTEKGKKNKTKWKWVYSFRFFDQAAVVHGQKVQGHNTVHPFRTDANLKMSLL